ncbi:glycoside hydrolase family 2 TIM barrel-domain containing protein [Sphingobium sp. YR768]|uniref:glycoside hydrolase family 2 TIM barrel-domain containing protein n=1 Tax=Sphingobium sp. YR768 TaxID=1884365 RepID=UPI0008CF8AB5|nr:glycoside hydrolase family 2 TIM barrel-domain containing protein [Sphingobium sp. YR768]SES11266.1 beta-galactosidase [Sphingobium sp. YR768]
MRTSPMIVASSVLLSVACAPSLALAQSAAVSSVAAGRHDAMLSSGWMFQLGDEAQPPAQGAGWQPVEVPHSWNRIGTYAAGSPAAATLNRKVDQTRGTGWYRLTLPANAISGTQRLWLEFGAASRTAEVWLNGKKLGDHAGGFSRFRFDATDAYQPGKDNVLLVKVDNRSPDDAGVQPTLPLAGDFFVHGGLYRPVKMVVTQPAHFAMLDHGGSGVYAHTRAIDSGRATISVLGRFNNDAARPLRGQMLIRFLDKDGREVARQASPVQIAASGAAEARAELAIDNAHLWQGTADPYLYTMVAELRDAKGAVLDSVSQFYGVRTMALDVDRGFILNGKPYPLHGVGLHQDIGANGWALTDADIKSMVATIREMGANTIRLTHYQHGPVVHDLADRLGLVLWDEIPLVSAWTLKSEEKEAPKAVADNARQQLVEMIRQNYNHPSVAVWSIANEVDFGPNRPGFIGKQVEQVPDPRGLLTDLNALAKAEDPTRPTALANCCEDRGMDGVPDVSGITDALGINRYMGWYYGKAEDFSAVLDSQHRKHATQPLALTEYGGGGATSQHTDNPLGGPINPSGGDQPEEYQAWLHEQIWPQISGKSYLWGSWLWNSFDFATMVRKEGDSIDINTKGLATYDGAIRKDAWWYYRVNWSKAPAVQMAGKRYVDRAYGITDIKIYSNAPETELLLNGKSIGTMRGCAFATCVWPGVRLSAGSNHVEVRARFADGVRTDAVDWTLNADTANAFRIDSGAILAAKAGLRYGSDAFFEGGAAGTTDTRKSRWSPIQPAKIEGTADRDLLASFRSGDFRYHIPAKPGRYTVILHFVEPALEKGKRLFDVTVNGKTALAGLDVAAAAGGTLKAIERRVSATAGAEGIVLAFKPRVGEAVVSAIEVVPTDKAR